MVIKRKFTKRKSSKRKTTKRKSTKRKSPKRKTTKRKSSKRKSSKYSIWQLPNGKLVDEVSSGHYRNPKTGRLKRISRNMKLVKRK